MNKVDYSIIHELSSTCLFTFYFMSVYVSLYYHCVLTVIIIKKLLTYLLTYLRHRRTGGQDIRLKQGSKSFAKRGIADNWGF